MSLLSFLGRFLKQLITFMGIQTHASNKSWCSQQFCFELLPRQRRCYATASENILMSCIICRNSNRNAPLLLPWITAAGRHPAVTWYTPFQILFRLFGNRKYVLSIWALQTKMDTLKFNRNKLYTQFHFLDTSSLRKIK